MANILTRVYRQVRRKGRPVLVRGEEGTVRIDAVDTNGGQRAESLKAALAETAGMFAGVDIGRYLEDIREGRGEEGSALA